MVDLVVLADHVVLQLAVCGQNSDLAQERRRLIDADQVLTAAVEQRIGGKRLFLLACLALGLLHLDAACGDRERYDCAALGVDENALVELLGLGREERAERCGIRVRNAALKAQTPCVTVARKLRVKFFLARGERADRFHEIVAVLCHSRRNAGQQQLQLGSIAFLHR